ncbi:MAG: hypothetical protein L7T19_00975 [Pseudomonadales bacterium]|nr:hypothetical protein [Pseudomonadales bacterium]
MFVCACSEDHTSRDIDGDGVINIADAFPEDPNESTAAGGFGAATGWRADTVTACAKRGISVSEPLRALGS